MKCLGLLLLALVGHVYGQANINDEGFDSDLSDFCLLQCQATGQANGGYFPDPDNCCNFIVCKRSQAGFGGGMFSAGQYQGYSQTCMYPLVWNPANGACDEAKNVDGCDDSCHGGPMEPTSFTTNAYNLTGECYRGAHVFTILDFDPQCFLVNRKEDVVCCGIGQTFDLEACHCVGETSTTECDCLFCLPFVNNKVQDIVHDTYVDVTGISIGDTGLTAITDGGPINIFKGCFDGEDDVIRASSFINQYLGMNFSVSFHFNLNPAYDSARKNAIVSNGCCEEPGSIEVSVEGGDVTGRFETEDGVFDGTISAGVTTDEWHDVTLRYCGPTLDIFYDGAIVETQVLGGDVAVKACALTLGQEGDEDGSGFNGCLVNFSICRDCWTDEQVGRLSEYDEAAVICEQIAGLGDGDGK